MDQQQSNVLANPFQKMEFGDLVTLPNQVIEWKTEADKLRIMAGVFNDHLQQTQLDKLTDAQLTALDERINKAIVTISNAYTKIEGQRKAATQIIDEIKAYSMIPEKSIKDYPDTFRVYRNAIAKLTANRIAEQKKAQENELKKKEETARVKARVYGMIIDSYVDALKDVMNRMNAAFYAKGISELREYAHKLGAYTPVFDQATFDAIILKCGSVPVEYLSTGELTTITDGVKSSVFGQLQNDWIEKLTKERDRLVELTESRLAEIERGNEAEAQARIAQEAADREAALVVEAADKAEAVEITAEAEKMDAAFEVAAQAEPVASIAKGTRVRLKYVPQTHGAWTALLQSFVKNDMNLMTLDELAKKFSFVLTAGNKRLNEKNERLEAKGLLIEEDYQTRKRQTEAAA